MSSKRKSNSESTAGLSRSVGSGRGSRSSSSLACSRWFRYRWASPRVWTKCAGLEPRDLGDHVGKQSVGGDVEGQPEEHVGAALVELAGEAPLGHVELEQQVAGRQRHLVELADVPGADHEAARLRVAAYLLHHAAHLVDGAAVGSGPRAPLGAVDRPEVAVGVGPGVPDVHVGLVERADVGLAAEEPQQLVDDRAQPQALGGQAGKALGEVEAHLVAEPAQDPGARAVAAPAAALEDHPDEVLVLLHRKRGYAAPPPGVKARRVRAYSASMAERRARQRP